MKTFKQFISEAPIIQDDYPKPDYEIKDTRPYSDEHTRSISSHKGYKITARNRKDTPDTSFEAVSSDNKTHMMVNGRIKGNEFHVSKLSGHPDTKIKAHEFYHHLITHHGLTLNSSDMQSEGGAKVWQRLSEMPGIKMSRMAFGQRMKNDKRAKLHKGADWHKNYEDEKSDSYFKASKK
jgi:hypothetical protein